MYMLLITDKQTLLIIDTSIKNESQWNMCGTHVCVPSL